MKNNNLSGEIGLFFVIDNTLYSWGEPIENIKSINDFKSIELSHFDYFYDLLDIFEELDKYKDYDYGYFPRGRVVYDVKKDSYIIYLDKCLLTNQKILNEIILEFNINKFKYEFLLDEHYKCANCDLEIKQNNAFIAGYNQDIKR